MAGPPITKRRPDEGEDWALTLADMMTLLLCFFIIIVSISVVDKERFDAVAESMGEAMGPKPTEPRAENEIPDEVRAPVHTGPPKQLDQVFFELQQRFGDDVEAVEVAERKRGFAITLSGPVFFELGSAELTAVAYKHLQGVATALAGLDYDIEVEGHTDNIPMHSIKYPSNWELSSARAASVVRFFANRGFDDEAMRVVGYADTRPILPNEDELGRPIPTNQLQNRRVVILVSEAGEG